jgi:hypothetical protein
LVEDGDRFGRSVHFEPDGLGQGHEAEVKERAARLLAPGQVDGDEHVAAVVVRQPQANRRGGALDLGNVVREEAPPLGGPEVASSASRVQVIGTGETEAG